MLSEFGDVFYRFSDNHVEQTAPRISVDIAVATEKDLLAAKAIAPSQPGKIDVLLQTLREGEQPEKSVRVEIVNMKTLHVKRGEDGRTSRATIMSVDPRTRTSSRDRGNTIKSTTVRELRFRNQRIT